jgi:hypothetical protein
MTNQFESFAAHTCKACDFLKNMGKTAEELEAERLQKLLDLYNLFHSCDSALPSRNENQIPSTVTRTIRVSPGKAP